MQTKFIGAAALTSLIFTALWLILLIWEQAVVGLPQSVDQALRLLLAQTLQIWPGSAVGFFNGLAYALLAIPSLIYGLCLTRGNRLMKSAGWLLALNGAACVLGLLGYLTGSALLSAGILGGGFFFFLALFPLTASYWRPLPDLAFVPAA